MPESVGDRSATRVDFSGAAHPCDQDQADCGPNGLQSLTGGDESDAPTDEHRGDEIVQLTGLKIDIRELIDWACKANAEGRIASRQKDLPTTPQIDAGNEVSPSQKEERGDTEDRPRRSGTTRLELALLYHRSGEIIHLAEPHERGGFRFSPAAARAFFFRPQVGQMIGKFGQVTPHVPWRDASPQQAFAKLM